MNAEPPEEKAASEAEAGAMPEKRAGSRAAGGNSVSVGLEAGRIAQPETRSQGMSGRVAAGVQGRPVRDWDLVPLGMRH